MSAFEFRGEVLPPVNVLASRYASAETVAIFSDEARAFMERGLWITVMRAQADLGYPIPYKAIEDYESVQSNIDLDSIRTREEISGHDVNSRLSEFNELAGHQYAQIAMTSRDATEPIEQYQILRGLNIIHDRSVAVLGRFAARALEFTHVAMAARTHNIAAQTITLGMRFSNAGEELLRGHERIRDLRDNYPLRGIKGPVGTQQDMLDIFEGDANKVRELEERVARSLGFKALLGSVGQVYPRSLDLEMVSTLQQVVTAPANFATTLRLMAGHELATEGFKEGRVGSNAMPHKMNASRAERIYALQAILSGHATMAGHIAGHQWNEGDVSDSAARRVYIPDSFYATDGILLTTMSILDDFGAYPAVIDKELQRYLPFLTTTKALMAAVKAGMGREDAHEIIKKHAIAVALDMREHGQVENDLFERLGADERIPVSKEELDKVADPSKLTGLAEQRTHEFAEKVQKIVDANPEAAAYKPPKAL